MSKSFLLILGMVLLSSCAHAKTARSGNVILMMIDGVRWQEVFYGVDPARTQKDSGPLFTFPPGGSIVGNGKTGRAMTVSNPALISLPAYQSIMAGTTQPCTTNDCGRIKVETLQERLVRELKLPAKSVASIASWEHIRFAVEHVAGATFVNTGNHALNDGTGDPELERINREQAAEGPRWEDTRNDHFTFAHGLRYLKVHKPRFLYLSLNDSDEWAHGNDYARYLGILRQYNDWIQQLVTTLSQMGEYGANTTLIVTTDHGRGARDNWTDHGKGTPEAKYVWLYSTGPQADKIRTHADIRAVIETELGLKPLPKRSGD